MEIKMAPNANKDAKNHVSKGYFMFLTRVLGPGLLILKILMGQNIAEFGLLSRISTYPCFFLPVDVKWLQKGDLHQN